jgi:hypothetical protein
MQLPVRASPVAALLLLATACTALAQDSRTIEVNKRTTQGREVRLSTEVSWDHQCQRQGTPQVEVVGPPSSGTIDLRPASKVVEGSLVGSTSCSGIRFEGIGIYYTPQPSFEGTDRVLYDVRFPNGSTLHFVANVKVAAAQH